MLQSEPVVGAGFSSGSPGPNDYPAEKSGEWGQGRDMEVHEFKMGWGDSRVVESVGRFRIDISY